MPKLPDVMKDLNKGFQTVNIRWLRARPELAKGDQHFLRNFETLRSQSLCN
jgi:hypothetical protein